MANDELVKEMINDSDRSFLQFGTKETRCTLAGRCLGRVLPAVSGV
jgi:hypothetical protein